MAASFLSQVKRIAVVDHHLGQVDFGQLIWVEPSYSATCEMLGYMAKKVGWEITATAAVCLFVGIQADTGRFSYSNTSSYTLRLGADLVKFGANPWAISQQIYMNSLAQLKLLSRMFVKFNLIANGRIVIAKVSQIDLVESGAELNDLGRVVEELRAIKGVEVAVLIIEKDKGVKVSLRSHGLVDVGSMVINLGGGGHKNAAGVWLEMELSEAEEFLNKMLVAELEKI